MSKAQPTPRPWFQAKKNRMAIDAASEDGNPTEDYRIAKLYTSPFSPSKEVCEANAELIVRAVNAHDELVAACEEALTSLEPYEIESGFPALEALASKIRAAIAKAKGVSG